MISEEFQSALKRAVVAIEEIKTTLWGLLSLAEKATARDDRDRKTTWHNMTDTMMDCILKGEMHFRDPNQNFIVADYFISNEDQSRMIKKLAEEEDDFSTGKVKQMVLDIINERHWRKLRLKKDGLSLSLAIDTSSGFGMM